MSENYKLEIEINPSAYKKLDSLAQKIRTTPDELLATIIVEYLNKHSDAKTKTDFRINR